MADEFPPEDIDIDEATLVVMRENDRKLREIQGRLSAVSGDAAEREVLAEFLEVARRQRSLSSEVPGMENFARQMDSVIGRAEREYGL